MLIGILGLLFSACSSDNDNSEADRLNTMSYAFHYRDIDSASFFAKKALALSADYPAGKAEAYNNLAFSFIVRMDYKEAYRLLDSVVLSTDNQLELFVADVQYMRLCQRESKNKKFYDYRERALSRLKRIEEEENSLSSRMQKRLLYAKSEFFIICSTYYYYVGLLKQSKDAIRQIDLSGEMLIDTAQYLNCLYQYGSGGMITGRSKYDIAQKEFDYLFKCYILARQSGLVHWQANSLQSISEHLLTKELRRYLIDNNPQAIDYLNEDAMPDSLLAGYLAQKSLNLFVRYGDIYQTAGAYRTLSLCYWELGDYASSLICLENALSDKNKIEQAPDLVASIREHLSLVYSAMDDKYNSDINRNKYLDLQEETRQDRQFEARAEQLERTSMQLNVLIVFILFLIVIVIVLLFIFKYLRKKRDNYSYIEKLLQPLHEWEEINRQRVRELNDRYDYVNEQLYLNCLHIEKAKKRNLDNRAKIFLVNNVMPYIDRIINEIRRLEILSEPEQIRRERFAYMTELTDRINEYNDVLTHWIQLQQGQLRLQIESFRLQDVFDILVKSAMSFRLKGVDFHVEPSDAEVKADKILTLFMLNTLSDNARKFTSKGGTVIVSAQRMADYVEISVRDTGVGLTAEELAVIFSHKIHNGHGFGLMNCKGIMDKYRKISQIFNVCGLYAESEKGKGSRFYFRLPHGVLRSLAFLLITFSVCAYSGNTDTRKHHAIGSVASENLAKAGAYADSAYYSNIKGTYAKTLVYADSARLYLNRHYLALYPKRDKLMLREDDGSGIPAEISWFHDKLKTDYDIILDVRNESAVAALALHEWSLYNYNNKVYTLLFKEKSADNGLAEYCLTMQRSSEDKTIAVVVLVLLLATIVCAYYFLYYRHVLYFRFCVEKINGINLILLSDSGDEEKLSLITAVDTSDYPDILKNVVNEVRTALQRSVDLNNSQNQSIELAEDELHRAMYEAEKLYICNNVIDNCLSTLKHETMYYPSRIRQLVGEADKNIQAISEVALYYKELYAILCEQIQRQADTVSYECRPVSLKDMFGVDEYVLGDKILIMYLFDILKRQCGCGRSDVSVSLKGDRYVVFDVVCRNVCAGRAQNHSLFTPSASNIPFLICRQIVRENSELANLHGCGITAEPSDDGGTHIRIILARYVCHVNGN